MHKTESHFHIKRSITISTGHFVHDIYSSFLAPFLPLIIDKFNLTLTMAGLLTLFLRSPTLFSPFIGAVSERFNIRNVAIIAPAVTAITMSLLGVAPNYAVLCVLLLIAGTSAAIFHVIGPVMIAQVSLANLGQGMSFWMTGGELARTVGPLIAVWIVSLWSFEGSYPIMSIGIIFSILLYFSLKDTSTVSPALVNGNVAEVWSKLHKIMIPLTGIMVSRACFIATLTAFLPVYMVASGKSLWIGGASLAILELAGTVGTFLGGTISDHLGRRTVLLLAMPISSFLMFAFVYAPNWLLFPLLLLLGCSVFAIAPVMMAIVQDNCSTSRGIANGIYTGISFLTIAVITVLVGLVADFASLKMAFILSSLGGLAGVPIIFLLPKSL